MNMAVRHYMFRKIDHRFIHMVYFVHISEKSELQHLNERLERFHERTRDTHVCKDFDLLLESDVIATTYLSNRHFDWLFWSKL